MEDYKTIKEYINSALANLISNLIDEVSIPSFLVPGRSFYTVSYDKIIIITPKIIENILNELGWENVDNDKDWDDTYMTYVKDNKEFIFFYNGYTYEKLFYNMHERGDES